MTALIRIVVLLCLILFPLFASAADHAVRAPADCENNGDGTTWGCAASAGAAGAYDGLPATLTRGDTYYLGDGTYPGYKFDDAESGTLVISVKKATVAAHGPSGSWDNAYGDGVATFLVNYNVYGVYTGMQIIRGYYDIDGVTGGGPLSWRSGHGIYMELPSEANNYPIIIGNFASTPINVSNITISHMEIKGTSSCIPGVGLGVKSNAPSGTITKNMTFRYMYIHDISGFMDFRSNPTNIIIEYNDFKNACGNSSHHGVGIRIDYANSTYPIIYRYNRMEIGTSSNMTGWVGHYCGAETQNDNFEAYGNIFYRNGGTATGLGAIYLDNCSGVPTVAGWKVYNNTFIGLGGEEFVYIEAGSGNATNNLSYSCAANAWVNITSTNNTDTDTNPFVSVDPTNANFAKLAAPTTAGTTLSGYSTDMLLTTRGADGTWDRGALEYGGEADTDTPDITVGGAVIGTSGTTFTLVLDEGVTVSDGTGFTLACDGGEGEGLSYVSVSGGTLTFNVTGRIIDDDETCTLDYTTVANGIKDAAGNDLESIGDPIAVTNNSTHTPTAVTYTITVQKNSGSVVLLPLTNQIVISGENSTTFTCTPSNGWQCAWGGTCGATGNGTTYQKTAIDADCTVTLTATEIYLLN